MDVQTQMEQIARAFCRVFAEDGFFWIRTTGYDDGILKDYKDKEIKITISNSVVWADPSSDQTTPDTPDTFTECFNNGSPSQQQSKFTWTTKTTRGFTWSMTETLNTGLETSVEAGIPGVSKAGVKWSVNLSLSSTQSQSKSDEKDWNIEQPLNVAPESALKCTAIIRKNSYNVPFTVPVKYEGYVAIMTTKSFFESGNHHFPMGTIPIKYNTLVPIVVLVPIGSFLIWGKENGIDMNFTSVNPDSATFNVAGVCTGSQGIDYDVNMQPVSLNGCDKSSKVTELGEISKHRESQK